METKDKNLYFKVMGSIVNKKAFPVEVINSQFNGWQTIAWLGNHPRSLHEANTINSCRGNKYISKIAEYRALKAIVKIPRNTYLKSDTVDKAKKIILDVLCDHFKIGTSTAKEYFKILGKEKVYDIMEKYARVNEKQVSAKDLKLLQPIRNVVKQLKKGLK